MGQDTEKHKVLLLKVARSSEGSLPAFPQNPGL